MTDYNYIFESYLDTPLIGINSILPTIFVLTIVTLLLITRKDANMFIIIWFIIFSSMTLYGIYDSYTNNKFVKDAFKNKTYLVAEGEIENFHLMLKRIKFDVNKIHFEVMYTGREPEKELFYTMARKNKNGALTKNGQKVKIYYIEYELPTLCIPFVDRCIVFNEGEENKIIKLWVYN